MTTVQDEVQTPQRLKQGADLPNTTMNAAYSDLLLVRQRPLVDRVIITAAKEDVRQSSVKSGYITSIRNWSNKSFKVIVISCLSICVCVCVRLVLFKVLFLSSVTRRLINRFHRRWTSTALEAPLTPTENIDQTKYFPLSD